MNALLNIFKIPELRKRLTFTLAILAVYRVGIFITTPGVNRNVMQQIVSEKTTGFLAMFDLFSGGALERLSIFALGIMPYVSASIILQLMTVVFKPLEELRKEGEAGQRKINQYTRYATVVLSIVQSMGIALYLESLNGTTAFGDVVREPGPMFRFLSVVSMTTGTAFIMWLGEQITERGLGNGISLLIFAGIVSDLPPALLNTQQQVKLGQLQPISILVIAMICLVVIYTIVFFERGQRRIPINYAKRIAGRKLYGGQTSHLPLRVNSAGVIPPIFASSLLLFPNTLANFKVPGMDWVQNHLVYGQWGYTVLFVALIVFFCFFYVAVTFQPAEVADNLKKQSAFIPGVRPGKSTADYIDFVLSRITAGGAFYIAAVCVVPTLLQNWFRVPFTFGGTSIMIVVGVALDTVQQIESYLISHNYEGFAGARGPKIRGRRAEQ